MSEHPVSHDYINEYEIRCRKVQELEAESKKAWSSSKKVSCEAKQAASFSEEEYGKVHSFAGRIINKRDHGKTIFFVIRDRTGTLQWYVNAGVIGEQKFSESLKMLDVGDYVWSQGTLFKTRTNELTVRVQEIELLSKCIRGIPWKFSDVEKRYRHRSIDLIVNDDVRERFKKRSKIIQAVRSFLDSHDFLEVETPMLHPIPGGAAARPFITRHNALDTNFYLRIAPELYLKRLMVGGFERVYEINRNFRNEGVSTRHNPEFTMLEFYIAHYDYEFAMTFVEELLRKVILMARDSLVIEFNGHVIDFSKPFARKNAYQAIIDHGGISKEKLHKDCIDETLKEHGLSHALKNSYQQKIFTLFEHTAEKNLIQPTYLIDFPIELSPLAKARDDDNSIAARFELFVAGMEISNGFSELNDPFEQAKRFKQQVEARNSGDEEAMYFDADYIYALEHALPPAAGVGIGIDRLVMLATNAPTIKEVIFFPSMKHVNE